MTLEENKALDDKLLALEGTAFRVEFLKVSVEQCRELIAHLHVLVPIGSRDEVARRLLGDHYRTVRGFRGKS